MSDTLYWVGRGSSRWTDVRNWSRASGGPAAGVRPTSGTRVVLDEEGSSPEANLFGCPHASLSINGFRGCVTLPSGGQLNMAAADEGQAA